MRLRVLGRVLEVPGGVPLLRGLEEACPRGIASVRFCREGECGSCKLWYRLPGDPVQHKGRACRLLPLEGMEVTVLSPELKLALRSVLD